MPTARDEQEATSMDTRCCCKHSTVGFRGCLIWVSSISIKRKMFWEVGLRNDAGRTHFWLIFQLFSSAFRLPSTFFRIPCSLRSPFYLTFLLVVYSISGTVGRLTAPAQHLLIFEINRHVVDSHQPLPAWVHTSFPFATSIECHTCTAYGNRDPESSSPSASQIITAHL